MNKVLFVQEWWCPETELMVGATLHLTSDACEAYELDPTTLGRLTRNTKWHKVLATDELFAGVKAFGSLWVDFADMDSILAHVVLPHPPTAAFKIGYRQNPEDVSLDDLFSQNT